MKTCNETQEGTQFNWVSMLNRNREALESEKKARKAPDNNYATLIRFDVAYCTVHPSASNNASLSESGLSA